MNVLLSAVVSPIFSPGMTGSDHRACGSIATDGSDCGTCCRALGLWVVIRFLLRWRLLLGLRRLLAWRRRRRLR
jgi:hypothetical protein